LNRKKWIKHLDDEIKATVKHAKKHLRNLRRHLAQIEKDLDDPEEQMPTEKVGRAYTEFMVHMSQLFPMRADRNFLQSALDVKDLLKNPETPTARIKQLWKGWHTSSNDKSKKKVLRWLSKNPAILLYGLEDPEFGREMNEAFAAQSMQMPSAAENTIETADDEEDAAHHQQVAAILRVRHRHALEDTPEACAECGHVVGVVDAIHEDEPTPKACKTCGRWGPSH